MPGIIQLTQPTSEPISPEEARDWLRVDGTGEDATILTAVKAARRMIERRTNRALITSDWRASYDGFPHYEPLQIPRGPVSAISAIRYVDVAGAQQTMATDSYIHDLSREPVRIAAIPGTIWPATRPALASVQVDFTAGYASATDVPDDLKMALRLLIAHWFDNRGAVMVGTISTKVQLAFDELVEPYRIWSFR